MHQRYGKGRHGEHLGSHLSTIETADLEEKRAYWQRAGRETLTRRKFLSILYTLSCSTLSFHKWHCEKVHYETG
jgi:hypothetical protein